MRYLNEQQLVDGSQLAHVGAGRVLMACVNDLSWK